MFKNYIKIAWRNLWRNKLYGFINIGGLALGLCICMLIMLYVAHEHSYDSFHQNAKRIFFAEESYRMYGAELFNSSFTYPVAPTLKKADAGVADYIRIQQPHLYGSPAIIHNPKNKSLRFSETEVIYSDPNFFSFFSFPLISGNVKTVLRDPFSVVISQQTAHKYFGKQDPVGKTLSLFTDSSYVLQVTGVMANSPSNTDLKADFVISLQSLNRMRESASQFKPQYFGGGAFTTYLLLNKVGDTTHVKRTLLALSGKKDDAKDRFFLYNVADMHLAFGDSSGNIRYLKIFPVVAALVLLLALVNYMNLSTARATLRAKEIGVRKVNGAGRVTIARQFYTESALYALLSFALAAILFSLCKPLFFDLLQLKIDTSFLYHPVVLMLMTGLLLFTILAAGLYPAIVLSAFKPVQILSGKMSNKGGGSTVRKIFTTVQFVISVSLMICGIVIYCQLDYMRHTETGVQRENVLMVPLQNTMTNHYQTFKNDLQNLPGVQEAAMSNYPMYKGTGGYIMSGKKKDENITFSTLFVDENFISMLGIQWKNKPANPGHMDNGKKVVINEAAIQRLKLTGSPIGQYVDLGGKTAKHEIVGVVNDFHFQAMDTKIDALVLFINADTTRTWERIGNHSACIFLKTGKGTNLPSLISRVKNIYEKYDRTSPFEYQFMDEAYNALYKSEDRLAGLFGLFIGLTVFIAGIGLFGLATFSAQQRIKEIGIRKVLGASVKQITSLLSSNFMKLVFVAILIASPIAYFAMEKWLQDFAYRIHIQWWVFVLAGGLALLIALFTVSFQAIKAALANPVKSLRTE